MSKGFEMERDKVPRSQKLLISEVGSAANLQKLSTGNSALSTFH